MCLDISEREVLRFALKGFRGEVYLFGSRLDDTKRGRHLYTFNSTESGKISETFIEG